MNWRRFDWLILLALTLLAATLRLYKLGIVPPGFQFDEGFNAIDAAQVLAGNRPLFLPANAGREVLYTYWQAIIITLTGGVVDIYHLRLGSALAGIIGVPSTYIFLRTLLRRHSRAIAFFVSLTLALSLWNIHFSHFGIRVIMMPMMLCVALGFYWGGCHSTRTLNKLGAWTISGIVTGLTVWTHPTGRLVPFILMGYTLWLFLSRCAQNKMFVWKEFWSRLGGLILTGIISFLVFLPLGYEFYQRPDFFLQHVSESSILDERVSGGSPGWTLVTNAIKVAGMFNLRGDWDWTHNLPGRPVFDPLLSIPFLIGLVIWGLRLRDREDPDRNALALLALWFVVMLLPSVLSNDAPDFSRTLPSHPALFVSVGLGLYWLASRNWLSLGHSSLQVNYLLVGFILTVSGGVAFYDYFVQFPQRPEVYYMYDVDKQDTLEYLAPFAEHNSVYLSRIWAGHATVTFLRGQYGIKSIDTSETVVLPPVGKGLIYAFPDEQEGRTEKLIDIWPESIYDRVLDPYGKTLLHVVRIAQESLTEWPTSLMPTQPTYARFAEAPTLLGAHAQDGQIALFWQAEEPMYRALTSFIHLLDENGGKVGQFDKIPGNGSYSTPRWSPGERVVDQYAPQIFDPCASGQEVRIFTGWYELAADGARRPRIDASGDLALAGRMVLPLKSFPTDLVTPENQTDVQITDGLRLVGYRVKSDSLQAGSPFALELYWMGELTSESQEIAIQLQPAYSAEDTNRDQSDIEEGVVLWTGAIAIPDPWPSHEVICKRIRLHIPEQIDAGNYELQLADQKASPPKASSITELTLEPSTRLFRAPSELIEANHSFEGEIQLLGYQSVEFEQLNRELAVTLIWQALQIPLESYKVFLHLLDEQGQIVAQVDAIPADGYATNRWVGDEIIIDSYTLQLPQVQPGTAYRLVAGLYEPLSGRRLLATDVAGQPVPDSAVLITEMTLP